MNKLKFRPVLELGSVHKNHVTEFLNYLDEKKFVEKVWKSIKNAQDGIVSEELKEHFRRSDDLRAVIGATPEEMGCLIRQFGIQKISQPSKKRSDIWKYDYFRTRLAFDFYSKWLDASVCPYCNRNYLTVASKGKNPKLLYAFDHFFSKTKYPYLSLSFYNLVPSCSVCNSQLKGDAEYSLHSHIHPFLHGFHEAVAIYPQPKLLEPRVESNGIPWEYMLNFTPKGEVEENWIRAKGNITDYRLMELYSSHLDEWERLKNLAELYPKSYLESLARDYPELFPGGIPDVLRHILGVEPDEERINHTPLGKLKIDLYKQIWGAVDGDDSNW